MTFKLGKIPVKVHGSFFLTMLFFGMNDLSRPALLAVWVLGAFVAVLLHELGHALAGRAFGLVPAIELHGMGGHTSWIEGKRIGPGKQIVISLAGPLVGIVLGAMLLLVMRSGDLSPLGKEAIWSLVYVNLGWGLFNLLPILPLDGGNILLSFFQLVAGDKGARAARYVSIGFTLLLGLAALFLHQLFVAVLCGLFLYQNVKTLSAKPAQDEQPLVQALEQAYAALDRQDGAEAIRLVQPVFLYADSPELKATAVRLLAYAHLLEGQWGQLMPILERFSPIIGAEDLLRFERAAAELGRPEETNRIRVLRLAERPVARNAAAVEGFRA